MRTHLPAAPASTCLNGQPAFTAFSGTMREVSWPVQGLGSWSKRFHHKRWQYAAIALESHFIGLAIVDVGWTSSAFAYVFDRQTREVVAGISALGTPLASTVVGDIPFSDCTFTKGSEQISFNRDGCALDIHLRGKNLVLDARVSLGSAPIFGCIAPANWLAHSTHKSGGLSTTGSLVLHGRDIDLDAAVTSLDYSNGLLAHRTQWQWASAHGREIGFNLQAGYMGEAENAVWHAGRVWMIGEVAFSFDPVHPLNPWQIRADDGSLDLVFHPEGARRENKNLIIAASRYIQPIGTFTGTLRDPDNGHTIQIDRLCGVTEDHSARW
ncbi:DUF2804 domain-containing protein [Burkholderiaceae bacterium DAT-1]|nr:DUF2804 domain-containing protein [Burkholderiaceae bacterium DAT-1]